jgi:hypothetical protein
MVVIVRETRDDGAFVQIDHACRLSGERTNAFIVADSNEPIVLYRKCLLRCEMSVNGYNLAIEKNHIRRYC